MVCIPDPGKRTQDRYGNRKACEYTHDQHSGVVVFVVNKYKDYLEY